MSKTYLFKSYGIGIAAFLLAMAGLSFVSGWLAWKPSLIAAAGFSVITIAYVQFVLEVKHRMFIRAIGAVCAMVFAFIGAGIGWYVDSIGLSLVAGTLGLIGMGVAYNYMALIAFDMRGMARFFRGENITDEEHARLFGANTDDDDTNSDDGNNADTR